MSRLNGAGQLIHRIGVGIRNISPKLATACEVIVKAPGYFCDAICTIKDSPDNLAFALRAVSDISDAVKHSEGKEILNSAYSKSANQVMDVIDVTRVGCDIHYFFSGNFLSQIRDLKTLAKAIGRLFFACGNLMSTLMGIQEMGKFAKNVGATQIFKCLEKGFAICGWVANFCDSVQRLVEEGLENPSAWFDMAACISGIALPILGFCGCACPPLLIALGLFSCAMGIASALYEHYDELEKNDWNPKRKEVNLDVAAGNDSLGKVLGPVSASAPVLERVVDPEEIIPLKNIATNIKSFGTFNGGLSLFTFLRDFLYTRFWMQSTCTRWILMNKICMLGTSIMNFLKFLNSVQAIDLAGAIGAKLGRLPIFQTIQDAFSVIGTIANTVETGNKVPQQLKVLEQAKFKFKRWETLAGMTQLAPALGHEATKEALRDIKAHYRRKIQRLELNRPAEAPDGIDRVQENITRLEDYVRALEQAEVAKVIREKKAHAIDKREGYLANELDPAKQAQLQNEIDDLKAVTPETFARYKREVIAAKSLADAEMNLRKSAWSMTVDILKVVVPIFAFIGALCAIASSTPFLVAAGLLGLATSLASAGKIFNDGSVGEMKKPTLAEFIPVVMPAA